MIFPLIFRSNQIRSLQAFSPRIFCNVGFIGREEPLYFNFLVDTGAQLSVLPMPIWENIHSKFIEITHKNTTFVGFKNQKECEIHCHIGKVTMYFFDRQGKSMEIHCSSYLLKEEDVTSVLGVHECLENFHLNVNFPTGEASLQG